MKDKEQVEVEVKQQAEIAVECISTNQSAKKDLVARERGLIEGTDVQQLQEQAKLARMLQREEMVKAGRSNIEARVDRARLAPAQTMCARVAKEDISSKQDAEKTLLARKRGLIEATDVQ